MAILIKKQDRKFKKIHLQFFCGMGGYEDKLPFDPSLMAHFRKRLTPEILSKINEMVITKFKSSNQTIPENPPKNSVP